MIPTDIFIYSKISVFLNPYTVDDINTNVFIPNYCHKCGLYLALRYNINLVFRYIHLFSHFSFKTFHSFHSQKSQAQDSCPVLYTGPMLDNRLRISEFKWEETCNPSNTDDPVAASRPRKLEQGSEVMCVGKLRRPHLQQRSKIFQKEKQSDFHKYFQVAWTCRVIVNKKRLLKYTLLCLLKWLWPPEKCPIVML